MNIKFKPMMPKEHGMWVWVLLPPIVGSFTVEGDALRFLPFFGSVLFWFLAFTPARIIYKNSKKKTSHSRQSLAWCGIYSAAALLFTLWSVINDIRMMAVFLLFAPLFYAGVRASHAGFHRSFLFELAGIISLSFLSPAGAFAVAGNIGRPAMAVWALLLVFLLDRNFQARNSVRGIKWLSTPPPSKTDFRNIFRKNILNALFAGALAGFILSTTHLPAKLLLPFMPGLLATLFFYAKPPPAVRVLGWTEMGLSTVFAMLMVFLFCGIH